MRRLAIVLGLLCCAVAGCGGDEAKGPLDEALGYLPKNAPLAVAVETNTDGRQYRALGQIAEKFPFGDDVKQGLENELEESGRLNFDRDVKPLLGNPLVVGFPNTRSVRAQEARFVAAIQTRDADKLQQAVERERGNREVGERSGAKLYRDDDGDFFAVKDDVLVFSDSRALLERAVDQREQDERLRQDDFDQALEGLPSEALFKVYGDLQALIAADPDSREARRIEWVRSLRKLGVTGVAEDDNITVDFKAETEGDLSEEDLPIASGEQSPGVVKRRGEIGVGLRDPRQIVEFAEAAGQAANPSGFGDYAAGKRQLEQRLGVHVDEDVIGQFTGDVSITIAVDGDFGARAEVEDPDEFRGTLRRLAGVLPSAAEGAGAQGARLSRPAGRDGLYQLSQTGGDTLAFNVIGDVFVLANDPGRARQLAAAAPSSVSGVNGSVVVNADAEQVADELVARLGGSFGLGGPLAGRIFTGPLDDLTGSVSADPTGLRGELRLAIE